VLFQMAAVVDKHLAENRVLLLMAAVVDKHLAENRVLLLMAAVVDKHLAMDTSYDFSPYIYARQQARCGM
jgi:hypothetical protein